MSVAVKKLGVSFSGPSIVLVYSSEGVTRKREMPLRDLTLDSDCSAAAKRLKHRHSKYLETISDIKLEKLILLAREHIRGHSLQEGLKNVSKVLTVDPDEDLNKLSDKELKRQKQMMDISFDKNSVGKDHPDYVYDKQIDFRPGDKKAEWDSDDDNDDDDKIEAPAAETADSDDFW